MTVRAKLKNFVHMWQFWTIWQFWLIVTILNNCDNSEHFDNLYLLWQFLPTKTCDKRDFIIVKIVINSDTFEQLWLLWPIVTVITNEETWQAWLYYCENFDQFWLLWPIVTYEQLQILWLMRPLVTSESNFDDCLAQVLK